MEEGEVQIFFLIATVISFLSRRALLSPYYGYQLTKCSIAKA